MPFDFLRPVESEELKHLPVNEQQFGAVIHKYESAGEEPDLSAYKIALFGIRDDRGNIDNKGSAKASEHFRKSFYQLYVPDHFNIEEIIDLGDILPGKSMSDTYSAISEVMGILIKQQIIPILIGGSVDNTFGQFLGYEKTDYTINVVTIDNRLCLGTGDAPISEKNYLSKIILHQPNYLFNYSALGYQSYYVSSNDLALLEKLNFDGYRLGHFTGAIQDVEPIIRNADMVSFNMRGVRAGEMPGIKKGSPNGFYGDTACQLARYAGMSDKLSSIGFYEYNPDYDIEGRGSELLAQMIWYFMDGYFNRKKDYPFADKEEYLKYTVTIEEGQEEIVFYKSEKSDRWWMEVPYPSNMNMKFKRHMMVPCTYDDYERACENELPDRWLLTYQKLK